MNDIFVRQGCSIYDKDIIKHLSKLCTRQKLCI